jgi:hypothetical protein
MTERKVQYDIVRWFNNTYCLLPNPRALIHSIPNEMAQTSVGLYPGAGDLLLIIQGHPLYLECKTTTGRQSPAQHKFEAHAKAVGAGYYVVRSVEDAKAAVKNFCDEHGIVLI